MSFKSFILKTDSRPIPAKLKNTIDLTRKYLPNGFYVGQRVQYISFDNITQQGTVIEISNNNPTHLGHQYRNNTTNVWANWDHSSRRSGPGYMPVSRVTAVE